MTSKAYLVTWLGKGNITWTPLESATTGLTINPSWSGPLRSVLDTGAAHSDVLAVAQRVLDPSMAALSAIQSTVSVAAGLAAVGVGLQLTTLAAVYRVAKNLERVDQQLKVIGGKFELHFLDQSIENFLTWHQSNTGLIPAAAAALEEDCHNALDELVANKNLRLPGYLKLKLASLAEAIDAYSQFLYAVIHNGSVPHISEDRLREWLLDTRSVQKGSIVGGFVSQRRVLDLWTKQLEDKKWKPDLDESRLSKALDRGAIERTHAVLLLAMQIAQAIALSAGVEDKLRSTSDLALVVRAA